MMQVKKDGNKVVITLDLFKEPYTSSTGKSTILFTSKGFQWVEGIGINLTIIKSKRKPPREQ